MNPTIEKSSQGSYRTIQRLLAFARPYWREISLSVALSVATTAVSIGLMGTSAFLIATAALQPSIAVLQVAIVGVRTFGIARGVFRYLERLVSHSVNFRLLAQVRGWFFRAVEPLVPGGVEDLKSGDLLARSTQDIETLEDFYVRGIAPPLSAVIVTLGISLFTLQYSLSLAACLASGLILTGLILSIQVRSLSRRKAEVVIQSRAKLSSLAVETISGAGEILMANAEERHMTKIRAASQQAQTANLALAALHSAALASGVLISNLTLVGMLYLGIPLVRIGQIDGVTLAMLALITLASFEPVNLLPAASAKIETSRAAANRLFSVADRPLPINEPIKEIPLARFTGLRLTGLTFSYPGSALPALSNISLSLKPGSKIALVGLSGSGKSTLLKVIQHYLPVPANTVFWNETDSASVSGPAVRGYLSVLSQNGYLFSATLRENLKLANSSEDEFERILDRVGLSAWFSSLPQGMDSWLGDNGSLLSGGERQRLLLARTLLMNRPIILADEPFSNLDPVSEKAILYSLLDSDTISACIVATHRLVGMDQFDEILVLDTGKIIQQGKHEELVDVTGLYRQLWQQQNNRFSFDL
jgi:ATP-binding cassette, subfamily C, bacterial CydC